MTLCPVALAVGCRKCPIFSVCPLTTVLGDQQKAQEAAPAAKPSPSGVKKVRGRKKGR